MFRAPGSRTLSEVAVPCNCHVSCSESYVFRYQTGPCNAPVTPLTLLQRPGRCNAPDTAPATLLQRSQTLQLLLPSPQNAPATLPDAATAACEATERACNAPAGETA